MTAAGNVLNGRFRLDQLIGRGAFAQVYLSTDMVLHRQVAVKVLHPDRLAFDDQVDFLTRFTNEARLIAGMEHPNILGLYDYGQADQFVYLVMPYVDGGSLHQALLRVGRFSPAQVGEYLRQVATALDYAHRRGIVHRDIKPQNMLLRQEDNHVLLADFGIAKVLGADTSQSGTGIIGSPAYMAPEQFQGRVGRAADLYALACVIFELLTGKPPYPGTLEQTMFGHVWGPVPPLAEYLPGMDTTALQAFFNRAMAKSPEARFPTAKALSDAYQQALGGVVVEATSSQQRAGVVRAASPAEQLVAGNGAAGQSLAVAGPARIGEVQAMHGSRQLAGAAVLQGSQSVAVAAPLANGSGTGSIAAAPAAPAGRQWTLAFVLAAITLLGLVAGGIIIARSGRSTPPPATPARGLAEATALTATLPTAVPTGVPTLIPVIVPPATAMPPTSTPTSVPTTTPTATPTAIPTPTPTVVPTATPVPPPVIGVFGFGTVARGGPDPVTPEEVVESFTAGQEVFVFANFAGARPNQDQFELVVVANDVPQPAQPVPLVAESGFVFVPLGAVPAGNYRIELWRNGALQYEARPFVVAAPAPTPVPNTTAPTATPRPAAPTSTPTPANPSRPTPLPGG